LKNRQLTGIEDLGISSLQLSPRRDLFHATFSRRYLNALQLVDCASRLPMLSPLIIQLLSSQREYSVFRLVL
jgi:hypothetical protein